MRFQVAQVVGTLPCNQHNMSKEGQNMVLWCTHCLKEVIPLASAHSSVATSI